MTDDRDRHAALSDRKKTNDPTAAAAMPTIGVTESLTLGSTNITSSGPTKPGP
jgi:hypothetical protein